jgi:hypothetical protein
MWELVGMDYMDIMDGAGCILAFSEQRSWGSDEARACHD